MYLLVLGYLMASFGHFEVTLRVSRNCSGMCRPCPMPVLASTTRLGGALDRIRDFYDAHLTLLIMQEGDTEEMRVRQSTNQQAS